MDQIQMMDLTTGMKISVLIYFFLFIIFYRTTIEDLKLIQKLRQRKNGLSAEELALGKQTNPLFSSRKTDVRIFMFFLYN